VFLSSLSLSLLFPSLLFCLVVVALSALFRFPSPIVRNFSSVRVFWASSSRLVMMMKKEEQQQEEEEEEEEELDSVVSSNWVFVLCVEEMCVLCVCVFFLFFPVFLQQKMMKKSPIVCRS
jgi:hypothetical protein